MLGGELKTRLSLSVQRRDIHSEVTGKHTLVNYYELVQRGNYDDVRLIDKNHLHTVSLYV